MKMVKQKTPPLLQKKKLVSIWALMKMPELLLEKTGKFII